MIKIKHGFFYLLFIAVSMGYSQTIKVEYEQNFENSSFNLYNKYDLILTDSLSIYIERDEKSKEGNEKEDTNNKTYYINVGDKKDPNIYVNKRDRFYFQETFFGTPLSVKEDTFDNNWQIIDSTKQIANYQCKLATKKFRGRKYYVWYTNEIPTNFGPWKLNGVGGLILEARDEKNEFTLNALTIKAVNDSTEGLYVALTDKVNTLFGNEKNVITFDELKKFLDEKNQIILNRINQQFPGGTSPFELDSDCDECNDSLENY